VPFTTLEEIKVVRKSEARNFLEDEEHCRYYINTNKLLFGTSHLLPGKRGAVDTGHELGDEIFYCARGRVLCYFPHQNLYRELFEGDIVVIPPKEPHQLINTSTEEAVITWSLAPPDPIS
jgi:mannose-6-phosphate isomerase-like protein (cupin superfamily)